MTTKRNPVGWFEIYVSDMPRATKFYETILELKTDELPMPDDSMQIRAFPMPTSEDCGADIPGAPGALVQMEGMAPGGSGTLVYFSCDDCATEESRVAGAGGQVVRPKFSIGEHGFIALVVDTEGNTIGLHSNI